MAATENLTVDQGTYWSKHLLWKDASGDPVNLTGYTARMQVRKFPASTGDPVVELTNGDGRITLGGSDGTILLELSAIVTAALAAGNYHYDLELVPAGGQVRRLIQGRFAVSAEVTR